MDKLLIVKTGDALAALIDERGHYEDWIIRGLGLSRSSLYRRLQRHGLES